MQSINTYQTLMKKRYVVYATVTRADGATMKNMPICHESTQADAKKRVAQVKRDGLGDWAIDSIGYYSEVVGA